jgi:hypothetical protein
MDDSITRRWVSEASELAMRYQARTGRLVIAWLILVVVEPLDLPAMRSTIEEKAKDLSGLVRFSIVKADEIPNLSLPDLRAK